MDRELFSEVSCIVAQMRNQTPIKSQFTDSDIVVAFLWAVRHDRPVSWACRSRNRPLWARRRFRSRLRWNRDANLIGNPR